MAEDTITRNEKGQIIGKTLSSETARAMQKRRYAKAKEDAAGSLLTEAGYTEDNPAPEHLKLLAEIAGSKSSGAVPAMRDFLKLTARSDSTSQPGKPAAGSICPLCNELVMAGFRPDDSQQEDITGFLERYRDNGANTIV